MKNFNYEDSKERRKIYEKNIQMIYQITKRQKIIKIKQNYPKNNKIYTQLTNLLNN